MFKVTRPTTEGTRAREKGSTWVAGSNSLAQPLGLAREIYILKRRGDASHQI